MQTFVNKCKVQKVMLRKKEKDVAVFVQKRLYMIKRYIDLTIILAVFIFKI